MTMTYDPRLEWERDGQYFHYLRKWMHALHCTSRVTGDGQYDLWARELAQAAHQTFVYQPAQGESKRMAQERGVSVRIAHDGMEVVLR